MNYQELIEKIGNLDKLYGEKFYVALDDVLDLVKQLDESQKVIIPQFVADWIEYCKVKKITLAHALYRSEEAKNKSVYRLIVEGSGHQETFARAWLDSYEVEKEKRYKISVKSNKQILVKFKNKLNKWFEFADIKIKEPYYTRKELEEAGFGWVFDCEGVEVQEVE